MRVGISISSTYSVSDPSEGARNMIERAATARQADLDSLFVGDHHITTQPYYQNSPMLGRLLAEWNNKPAGALYLLPLWHPVLLAEQIATLAAIMQGRFILQCALGGERPQSEGMGVDMKYRVPMFEDSLDIMRRLWAGETVTHERFWNIKNARIAPLPAQNIEVWVGSSAPAALNRTARLAEGWLAQPGLSLQGATDQLNQYRQACAEHNRQPNAVAVRRDIFVGASTQEAEAFKSKAVAKGYRGFAPESMLVGSVAQVADELANFVDAGFTDVIIRSMSSNQSEALAGIERMAEVKAQLEGSV
ncbi:MAG: LLM class flavin-dependent oxidoreductase [Pseudomonadales bacterium]|nr:LLM class flavin-dependent oxidoreductase [Pseudomonadales bacterium]